MILIFCYCRLYQINLVNLQDSASCWTWCKFNRTQVSHSGTSSAPSGIMDDARITCGSWQHPIYRAFLERKAEADGPAKSPLWRCGEHLCQESDELLFSRWSKDMPELRLQKCLQSRLHGRTSTSHQLKSISLRVWLWEPNLKFVTDSATYPWLVRRLWEWLSLKNRARHIMKLTWSQSCCWEKQLVLPAGSKTALSDTTAVCGYLSLN